MPAFGSDPNRMADVVKALGRAYYISSIANSNKVSIKIPIPPLKNIPLYFGNVLEVQAGSEVRILCNSAGKTPKRVWRVREGVSAVTEYCTRPEAPPQGGGTKSWEKSKTVQQPEDKAVLIANNFLDEDIENLEEVVKLGSKSSFVYRILAELYYEKNDFLKADKNISIALRLSNKEQDKIEIIESSIVAARISIKLKSNEDVRIKLVNLKDEFTILNAPQYVEVTEQALAFLRDGKYTEVLNRVKSLDNSTVVIYNAENGVTPSSGGSFTPSGGATIPDSSP